MRSGPRLRAAVAGLLLLALLSACSRVPGVYVYEGEGSQAAAGGAAAFDPATYVDGIWASKIIPTVTKVDTEAVTGPVTVEVPGAAGAKAVTLNIATGPVIAGTALRDGVGFIAFGDFTNQIAYADVANQINARVKTDVIAKVDVGALTGKKVTFHGAFSQLAPGQIFLVPTELAVAP